jgi:AAA domain
VVQVARIDAPSSRSLPDAARHPEKLGHGEEPDHTDVSGFCGVGRGTLGPVFSCSRTTDNEGYVRQTCLPIAPAKGIRSLSRRHLTGLLPRDHVKITLIKAHDVFSFHEIEVRPDAGLTVVVGPNGAGKTTE